MSKWIEFATPVEETAVDKQTKVSESYEQFLSRRTNQMAGMVGLLSSRLEIIEMSLKFDMNYDNMTVNLWRRTAKEARTGLLECLIRFQHEWADMQQYEEGDYGKEMYERKIAEYTTELEALNTLIV